LHDPDADPLHFEADPDSNYIPDADAHPDPTFQPDPDPDPTSHPDADPDPDPSFQIKAQTLEKVLK
jgi:type IV secretion system protein VirB6